VLSIVARSRRSLDIFPVALSNWLCVRSQQCPFQSVSTDPDAVIQTYPWGLTGIPEHPKYEALPNRARSAFEKPATTQPKASEAS
jgi:hypothetical protein